MSRRGTFASILLLLAAAASLAAPGAMAARRPRQRVKPAEQWISVSMPGTNGWHLHLGAVVYSEPVSGPLSTEAVGKNGASVTYTAPGYVTPGGRIRQKLPGIGRVDLRFRPTKEKRRQFTGERGCTNDGISTERSGWFVGTVEFHGEGGYTEISRRRAYGQITVLPREVCRGRGGKPAARASNAEWEETVLLEAVRRRRHPQLSFSAMTLEGFGSIAPSIEFAADYLHSRADMEILGRVEARGGVKGFPITFTSGAPSDATVKPPRPFTGSAAFKLESPTKASWTGDLAVDVPTLGEVHFTSPGFAAGICTPQGCTKTLPPGFRVSFFE